MANLFEIRDYCNDLLSINLFDDYTPNGLQVQGRAEVKKIVVGVTACQALLEAAVKVNADMILVHHGFFWKGEDPCITGMKHQRIQTLLSHDINLFGYHLPLDAHKEIGNNAQLAKILGLQVTGELEANEKINIGLVGELDQAHDGGSLAEHIGLCLGRAPLHIASRSNQKIKKVAWVTGGAQNWFEYAARAGCDAFISGEVSEQTFHMAKELDIHYFAAGHHATERYGVQALGKHLAEKFELEYEFIDIDNPV